MSGLVWSIILLFAALCVIGIEMFVPSAGLLAILSAVLIISSIVVAFLHSIPAGVVMIVAVALFASSRLPASGSLIEIPLPR